MADVNLTEASVLPTATTLRQPGVFGGTIVQGTVLYFDAADSKWKIADCTGAATDAASGIALTSGANGQRGVIATGGDLTVDNLTAGTVYILSAAGQLCPAADLNLATDYLTVVGAASSATNLKIGFIVTGYKTP
jgi:hypothetical protein